MESRVARVEGHLSCRNRSKNRMTANKACQPTELSHPMENHDLIGALAGTLTTVSFVPQVLKIWRSRSARDISFGMFSLFSLGVLLWLIYGISIQSLPIMLANGITLTLSLVMIAMKLGFDRDTT